VWLIPSVICDILIAVIMVRSLSRRTLLSKTVKTHVTRLTRLVLETGSLTGTSLALFSLTWAITDYTASTCAAPTLAISKIYANSVMVLLNNRLNIVGGRN
ncbi:hypothetical protein AMATHDRAFT_108302, partial [Amanita thiersii Skay4041]